MDPMVVCGSVKVVVLQTALMVFLLAACFNITKFVQTKHKNNHHFLA